MDFVDGCIGDSEEQDLSTQLLQRREKQLCDLQKHFKSYFNVLPVFGFASTRHDLNLFKAYLISLLVNERDIEPSIIKKVNQIVSFKLRDIQLLDIMNFFGGATSLDSFLRAYKNNKTKGFSPHEWFGCTEKLNNKELLPYPSFFNILRNSCPLENDYNDFENLVRNGLSSKQATAKLGMDNAPPTGAENYAYLLNISDNEHMQYFADFLNWYNNKDVVPTLEAKQKMIEFYQYKGIVMLKLGCNLSKLGKICLHKPADLKSYLFTEKDEDFVEKKKKDMASGPSIGFTWKVLGEETFIRNSTNLCKSIVEIDACQLYP